MTTDRTLIVGTIEPRTFRYLAGSPDAERCLAWLGPRHPEATLYMATWALKLVGQLEGPFESEPASKAVRMLRRSTEQILGGKHKAEDVIAPTACGHCGGVHEAASGDRGQKPKPGDYSVCFSCTGINRYDEELRNVRVDEAEIDALPADLHDSLREAQSWLRTAHMGGRSKTTAEA
jgi:hypothetical protein